MGKSAITIADIADRVGISAAAVSLALNDKKGVSDATRARVRAVAEESGYRINRVGRALRQSRTGAVGLYLPEGAAYYGYFTETVLGLTERLHAADITLQIVPSAPAGVGIESFPPVDGYVIIEPHSDDAGAAYILAQDLPVVCGDAPPPGMPAPWGIVESPNERTTRQVLDRFQAAGARAPGLYMVERVSSWSLEVEAAYTAWCDERDLPPRTLLTSIHAANEAAASALADWTRPADGVDAVLVVADGMAVRVAGLLRGLGRRPGVDIRLVSAVDGLMMGFHTPPITAVDLRPLGFAAACGELLLELLDGPRPERPVRRLVEATLRERESG